jgi:hypothetical protein
MAWVNVYIGGKPGFRQAVVAKLGNSWLPGSTGLRNELLMYWLPDAGRLKALKVAIGSKLVFKYRLEFITNLNEHLELIANETNEFSFYENELMNKMIRWDNTQREPVKPDEESDVEFEKTGCISISMI